MNNILENIFPRTVTNLIIRFSIHPVAESFKREIKIDEEEIQEIINYGHSFSFAYFQSYTITKTNRR